MGDSNQANETKNVTDLFDKFGQCYVTHEFQCAKHGAFSGRRVMDPNRKIIDPKCPQCEIDRHDAIKSKIRKDNAQAKLANALGNAGIPKRFQANTFESYTVACEEQAQALRTCRGYAESFPDALEQGRCMIFTGTTGTGKTMLSTAIANHVMRQGYSAIFTSVRKVLSAAKSTWHKNASKTEEQALRPFIDCDLLIIDEIGVQFDTDSERLIMFDVINARYENVKPMILISNYPIDAQEGASIRSTIGDRALDRLRECGTSIAFKWESHRGAQ